FSSSAVERIPNRQSPTRVLVVDDSVWTGHSLRAAVARVHHALPDAVVTTAAFVTHRQAPPGAVDVAYYRGVDDESYQDRRGAVVEYLQTKGSLLLDTDHIEIGVRIGASVAEFYEVLAGWGSTVLFASPTDRINCTVLQESKSVRETLKHVKPA